MELTHAKDLRPGDRLEPDGTEIIKVRPIDPYDIELVIKEPGKRRTAYIVAASHLVWTRTPSNEPTER